MKKNSLIFLGFVTAGILLLANYSGVLNASGFITVFRMATDFGVLVGFSMVISGGVNWLCKSVRDLPSIYFALITVSWVMILYGVISIAIAIMLEFEFQLLMGSCVLFVGGVCRSLVYWRRKQSENLAMIE